MKIPILIAWLIVMWSSAMMPVRAADYAELKASAEALYGQGSYAKAHEAYEQAELSKIGAAEKRWVEFRLADTAWRSEAATHHSDNTKLEAARHGLETLIRDRTTVEQHDRVWAEVEESLGDFFQRPNYNSWGEAWSHYQAALDWWAGAADVELARQRYLAMVWSLSEAQWNGDLYGNYWNGNQLPQEILENAVKIAQTPEDRSHAHFLLAMILRNYGGWDQRTRVAEEFDSAIQGGKKSAWYGPALFDYANWLADNGRVFIDQNGGWRTEPDYPKALELYRKFVAEFKKGETAHFDQAMERIKNITEPSVETDVGSVFLPDSEIQYHLSWRNVKRVELALYAADLSSDVRLADRNDFDWLGAIATGKKIKAWSQDTKDKGDYKPGEAMLRWEGKLAVGAYVLEAKAGGKTSRALLLITDAAVVTKTSAKSALIYVCDALKGSPLPGAKVSLSESYYESEHWQHRTVSKTANADGIAVFDLLRSSISEQMFVGANLSGRQAFGVTGSGYMPNKEDDRWHIYAYTDRPAYRPKETVQWKFTARTEDGGAYKTPANRVVKLEIADPRGAKVKEETVTLNAFGGAWGSLELKENWPLGEYQVRFWNEDKKRSLGEATLFRLEEYKLPEFKVTVQTPEENGRKLAFRLGETVTATVQADYYFGGAVSDADVEILVYQNPYYHTWQRPHEYPWLYEGLFSPRWGGRYYGGGNQIIKRETVKTDATGKATITFPTPNNNSQDFEYRIEARVTDASRREITANGTVRVTGQRYYVYPQAAHTLYQPHEKVKVDFKALDANEQPVVASGTVKVTRESWEEIWLDEKGREVRGEELRRYKMGSLIFPPPPTRTDERAWRLKFRGYEQEDIVTQKLATDTNGAAQIEFKAERAGYYRVAWSGVDTQTNARPAAPITAETTVWVTTTATTELGYRAGGLEIIADQDTFRVGEDAAVMLTAPASDRYVLFSVEGEDLHSYQVVHLTGTVKLLKVPIVEKDVPNIWLNAAMVSDRQFYQDSKPVVVPPLRNFLNVEITPDRALHGPREAGWFNIMTRDGLGNPVAAEVAFGLADESVYSIQSDYAGDPRQFYFGTRRQQGVRTSSTFEQRNYADLVEGDNKELIDARDLEQARLNRIQLNYRLRDQGGLKKDRRGEFMYDAAEMDKLPMSQAMTADQVEVTGAYFGGIGGMAKAEGFSNRAIMIAGSRAPMNAASPPVAEPNGAVNSTLSTRLGILNGGEVNVQVRSDFRSTVFWQPDVMTGADGRARVKVTYPESLTSWRATARAVTAENQFGMSVTNTQTQQPLMVRLEAPRFFVVGDTVTISAVVNNHTDEAMEVAVGLDGFFQAETKSMSTLKVPAHGEARRDWVETIGGSPGPLKLKVTAVSARPHLADAMERTITVYEHGIEKFVAKSGKVRGDDVTVKLELPKERRETSLTVQVTPSLAVTMLDALPYLIHYPYGCTEQTMSRFLPAVITAHTLKELGLKPEDVMGRVFGGIEATNAAATHPDGKRDLRELDTITEQSLKRLYDFHHADGGWGWWKQGDSDHFMTAYVVWGMSLAKEAGIEVRGSAMKRGAKYLDEALVEEEKNYDEQAWILNALAEYHAAEAAKKVTKFQQKAFDNLWAHRDKLNAYTRALLALAAHRYGFNEQAKVLITNLENGVIVDKSPDVSVLNRNTAKNDAVMGTAHWGEDGVYWRWSDGRVEATAFCLRALLAIDPQNKLIEPVTNWLLKNRRGAQWNNTRDTAITIMAMDDYLRVSGELSPEMEYALTVNGHLVAKKKITGVDVFNAPSEFAVDASWLRDGENDIRIARTSGQGPIYFSAQAEYYSLEEPIAAAGNEIFVKRQYYKLVGRPTLLKGLVYDRVELNNGDSVTSGDRVSVVLTIEAKNNYEYLCFEDLKPAGLEAVELRSGEPLYAREVKSGAVTRKLARTRGKAITDDDVTGRERWVYEELRDRKAVFFLDHLPQGVWQIQYDLRAEAPGQFHALPVLGQAMYVPEIRCNGAETHLTVVDKKGD